MFGRTAAFVIGSALVSQGIVATAAAAPSAPDVLPGLSDSAVAQTLDPVKIVGENALGAALVVDTKGHTTVVWAESSYPNKIRAIRRPDGGDWSKAVVIGRGLNPKVGADKRGRVTVAWTTHRKGFTDGVAVASRPAVGPWSDPRRLSNDRRIASGADPYGAYSLDLAVNPGGSAMVAWDWGSEARDDEWRIRSAFRMSGARWVQQERVAPAVGATDPQVGMGKAGNAVVVYEQQKPGHMPELKARTYSRGDGWGKASTVARKGYQHDLAADEAGNAVVAFLNASGTVKSAYRPSDGPWGTAENISSAGVDVDSFSLAMNRSGDVIVALDRQNSRIDVVRRPVAGPWSAPESVVPPGESVARVAVALNRAGDTILTWGTWGLYGTYQPDGGSWTEPFTIRRDKGAEVLEALYVGVAPDGDAVVLWDQEDAPLKLRTWNAD